MEYQCCKCKNHYEITTDAVACCNCCDDGEFYDPIEESEESSVKMKKEKIVHLLNSALDVLIESFGGRWLVQWAIDQGLTNEEIEDWVYDDMDLIIECRKESEEEENG